MINFSGPFSIRELKDIYRENPARALLAFNQKCDESLRKEVIIIEDPANDWIAEQLLKMGRHNMILPFFQWRFDTDDRRLMEKGVADRINSMAKASPDKLALLNKKVKDYTDRLGSARLSDENFARRLNYGWLRYFAVVAGAPIFLAGYIANLLPFIVPKYVCDKLIHDPRHYSSVYVSSGTVLYLIYFPVVLILATIFLGWTGLLLSLLVPVLGYLVLYYQEIFRERMESLRHFIKSVTDKNLVRSLSSERREIWDMLDEVRLP
jgi:hypothetical protein